MRKGMVFAVIFGLAGGPLRGTTPSAGPAAVQICPICGHACCCPEKCRKVLQERRRTGCDRAEAFCHLRTPFDSTEARRNDCALKADLRLSLGGALSNFDEKAYTWRQQSPLFSKPPFLDVLTPPPRISA